MATIDTIRTALEQARRELLDLTARNHLIHTPRSATRSSRLEIIAPSADTVASLLIDEGSAVTFAAAPSESGKLGIDERETEDETDERVWDEGIPSYDDSRRGKPKLQTRLTRGSLHKRLLKLSQDATTAEQELGVNVLYLSLGFLKWFEKDESTEPRYAPLMLVPVRLTRTSASDRFSMVFSEDDLTTNISLQTRLREDFRIELPEIRTRGDEEDDGELLKPSEYCAAVRNAVRGYGRWEVLENDIVLWFFSFSGLMMFRDLDPANWPEGNKIDEHSLVAGFLGDGFRPEPHVVSENQPLDPFFSAGDLQHVVDVDSSQAEALLEVARGGNLVLQGPPGTGKSQTIANVIASAVLRGQRVLFVAEKLAALEVVKRRLEAIGLGDICLELHSNKANKKSTLQELGKTLGLTPPQSRDLGHHCAALDKAREELNRHVAAMHTEINASRMTPYRILGELVRLRARGMRSTGIKIDDPNAWTREELEHRRESLAEYVRQANVVGNPSSHPLRPVRRTMVLPMDIEPWSEGFSKLVGRIDRLVRAGECLASALRLPPPASLLDLSHQSRLARKIAGAPEMDAAAIRSPVWAKQLDEIESLLAAGARHAAARGQLSSPDPGLHSEAELVQAKSSLAAYGECWYRFFVSAFWRARAILWTSLGNQLPDQLADQLAQADALVTVRREATLLEAAKGDALLLAAFGSLWRRFDSDWKALNSICGWERECRELKTPYDHRMVAAVAARDGLDMLLLKVQEDLKPCFEELQAAVAYLEIDVQESFGVRDLREANLSAMRSALDQIRQHAAHWQDWAHFRHCEAAVRDTGMADLARAVLAGVIPPGDAALAGEWAIFDAMIREAYRRFPDLARFKGEQHEQRIEKYRNLDAERLRLACWEVATEHHRALASLSGEAGCIGIVRREINKKRRHLPIRQLLARAGQAVQRIKPVFMMSPLSVAQYLEPGAVEFDLLVIDEASQVRPVDALGAVARAKQIVVVGDEKQLPPTSFFNRVTSGEQLSDDEEEAAAVTDMESILSYCTAQGLRNAMLRWHYRSRHHSLIAFSNHRFYDDKLYIVPNPGPPAEGDGLHFVHVPEGLYDRGKSRTNRREAELVAKAVMQHARERPHGSLGVGCFSVAQRDAIDDEIERMRREQPELEEFFGPAKAEPFFVKNLENIQGDERDVILISVGYGKNEQGYMSMSFGPLSAEGGERRLNVLVTRARHACIVFSSIHAGDIDLARAQAKGAHALKEFLEYAESGRLDCGTPTGKDHDSEFERQVALALKAHGFDADPQVGVAGFFIDLAVRDPAQPAQYLLGIECDGQTYHRARWARDRDRLRQDVLESRGWRIHRIWSTDWFARQDESLRKVLAAIEMARRGAGTQQRIFPEPASAESPIVREESEELGAQVERAVSTVPYQVYSARIEAAGEIHELPVKDLARIVAKIVEAEGPIHGEEVTRRVTQLFGRQRAGARIRGAVERALSAAQRSNGILEDGDFYRSRNLDTFQLRDRSVAEVASVREVEMLPPQEIREGVLSIVRASCGITADEAVAELARLLGYGRTSEPLRSRILGEINSLVTQAAIVHHQNLLVAGI